MCHLSWEEASEDCEQLLLEESAVARGVENLSSCIANLCRKVEPQARSF